MNKKEFLKLVKTECDFIKENATKQELSRLDFDLLTPTYKTQCIYGQMTGNCFSAKAMIMVDQLNGKLFYNVGPMSPISFTEWKSRVSSHLKSHRSSMGGYTPLEVYITLKGAKNKEVIEYLKGERKTLKL